MQGAGHSGIDSATAWFGHALSAKSVIVTPESAQKLVRGGAISPCNMFGKEQQVRVIADMKFRYIWFNRVKSDTGFIVKIRSFQGFAEFRETDHIAIVPVAPVVGQALVQIFDDSVIKWNPPYENEVISEEKRAEIIQNVAAAIRFRGGPVEIV